MPRIDDVVHTLRVLGRSGVLRRARPDRMLRMGMAYRHWGMSLAAAFAMSGARYEGRVAIVDERGTLTFAELDRGSDAQAIALARLGVRAGDVVGVLCRNHRGIVEVTGALSKLGAHALYLNTGFSAPQLREVASRERATTLVYDEEFSEIAADVDVEHRVLAWTDLPDGYDVPTLEALLDEGLGGRPPRADVSGRTIILTSGTTGTPKGANREQVATIAPAVAMLERIPYRTNETMVVAAPVFHSWGFGNALIGLLLGNTMVLERRFDAEQTLALVARHRARVLVAVPVMLLRILELPAAVRRKYDTSSLRLVPLSGSSLPGSLGPRFMNEFGEVIYNLYGSTEVGYVSIATPTDLRDAPGTAGTPLKGTIVKLLDAEGREVPRGSTGRIFVHSDLVFEGYTGGGSKEVIDGLMSTGDTGRFDADGRLFVDGRDDEMIVSGGENIFPREVEDLIAHYPDVVECAVVGVSDDEWGSRLKAYVVCRPGAKLDADALRDYVKSNLARYKVPRDVEFVDELPRNPIGKVLKRDLG